MKTLSCTAVAAILLASSAICQNQVNVPPHSSVYNGYSRGYNFTANTNFVIVQLEVPPDAMQAGDTAGFLVLVNGATILHSIGNTTALITLATPIPILNGDVVDIIGNWSPAVPGNFTAHNSYGLSAPYATTIEGVPHTLNRTGWQWDIGDPAYLSGAQLAPTTGSIGRVWMYTTPAAGFASWSGYGAGCPDNYASFYETWPNPGLIDLSGTAGSEYVIQMINTGTAYVITPGASTWFTPTSAPLILADDSNSPPQTLPFTLNYPGGSTTQVIVGSNGYVYLGPGSTTSPFYWAAVGVPGFLNDVARHAPFYGDLDPSVGGAVHFDVDPSGSAAYVTFLAVPEWNVPTVTATFQVCIQAGGIIEYRYRDCTISVATPAVTGWTPGNGARDPGPIDLSAAVPATFITGQDEAPLTLACTGRPVIGQSFSMDVGDIPNNTALAILFLSLGQTPAPGVPLDNAFGGMEGCFQHVTTPLATAGVLVAPVSTGSVMLSVPANPALAGLSLFGQAAAVVVPAAFTTSGLISSNGVQLVFDAL